MISTAMLACGAILLSIATLVVYEMTTGPRADPGWRVIFAVLWVISFLSVAVSGVVPVFAGVSLRRRK